MVIQELVERAKILKEKIGLQTYPVGVKFVRAREEGVTSVSTLHGYRYCQALMKARHGECVKLDREGIACPAAAAVFGFKPLPEGLKSGKGLVGFGITRDAETGRRMFEGMSHLAPGKIIEIVLFPLEKAPLLPDVVVVEDRVENLMWLALAYLNLKKGRRIESSTAILQATCVDATIIPYKEQRMNLSYGCYGCRDATDIGFDEGVLGFPFKEFASVCDIIIFLSEKAIPRSRGKNAYTLLKRKLAERIAGEDIFHDISK